MPDPNLEHARLIGEKLREVRQRKRISLRQLARQTEISASMLSQIETGKAYPSVRSIYSIAEALDVRVDYFFPEPDRSASQPKDFKGEASPDLTASEMRETQMEESREYPNSPDETLNGHTVTVVHADARPTIELNSGVTWARLTKDAEPDNEFLEVTYECGATSGTTMSRHAGREFGLILSGELTIQLGFETHLLSEGDSIVFDSATPHRLSNEGSVPMRALWIVMNRV
jgi:transcriptional regulator with XRE-family HTH domain